MTTEDSPDLPGALLLAWWATAWLRGLTSTDDVLDALRLHSAVHSVRVHPGAAPGTESFEGVGLLPLLAGVRRAGATAVGATFPAEGDPLGLGGPRDFNLDATEVGEAVLVREAGLGVVPHTVGAGTTWTVHAARPRPLPDLAEADRGLRSTLLATLDAMERLDVASWSPETADELLDLQGPSGLPEVPATPRRVLDVADRALRARRITEAALRDHGGAVSAAEVGARARAVQELDRAARVALAAAASPWSWPPEA